MGVISLSNSLRIATDPLADVQVDRYSMHMRIEHEIPVHDLPLPYTIQRFSVAKINRFAAVLFMGFAHQPERRFYPRLWTNRGCREMIDEFRNLAGFLEDASYVILYRGIPVAAIMTSRPFGCVFGQIHFVAVAQRHRRKGLGSFLVKTALNDFVRLNLHHVTVQIIGENRPGIKFFRVQGFRAAQLG
ncbi:MAG TPA: GNAT family N-acetyltransferase [bacterium]|jgi:ribosomal protein S18 acetylase RimI-like enzyme